MRERGWLIIFLLIVILGIAAWYMSMRGGAGNAVEPSRSGFEGPSGPPGVKGPDAPHP